MYTEFFGLTEKPFAITPDPRYLFMSERHSEALAHLVYGVTESGGFIQLTGEVGTGKTTLVRTLLSQVPKKADVALILNPQLTAIEFLQSICDELGITMPGDKGSTKALIDALNSHLLEAHAKGRRTILLVDEAQNLAAEVLEEVRLLTNLETAKQKLLQIILIGQPELRDLLGRNDLRQLAQRVTGRYHLQPLTQAETDAYISHRLRVAGALVDIFDERARREVYRLSAGIPRLVNVICDRALLGAYSLGRRSIDRNLVRQAAREIKGEDIHNRNWLAPVFGVAAVVIIALGLPVIMGQQQNEAIPPQETRQVTDSLLTAEPAGSAPAATLEEVDEPQPEPVVAPSPTLEEVLADQGLATGTDAAMTALFSLWGVQYEAGGSSACLQAEQLGLACLFQRGTWTLLRQLNRPAILNLTDAAGYEHQVVLTSIERDGAVITIGGEERRFSLQELSDMWYGEYLLLWNPPSNNPKALRKGMRDPDVIWLRKSLAAIDPAYESRSQSPDYFDEELEGFLRDFQRRNRLKVDGLAGQQTQIIINSSLESDNTPHIVKPT
jgi:general secretion pathway protein A